MRYRHYENDKYILLDTTLSEPLILKADGEFKLLTLYKTKRNNYFFVHTFDREKLDDKEEITYLTPTEAQEWVKVNFGEDWVKKVFYPVETEGEIEKKIFVERWVVSMLDEVSKEFKMTHGETVRTLLMNHVLNRRF